MFFISGLSPSAFFPSSASASGPSSNRLLNYQLRLTDPSGIPVADGTKNVKISFYAASTGGTPVATDCGTTGTPVGRKVVFTNGVGSVLIGETTADASHNCTDSSAPNAISATLFDNTSLFIGITVEADAEMTPRKRIVATGYSLNADKLDDMETSKDGGVTEGLSAASYVPVTDSSGNFTLSKNVTVDTDTFFVDAVNNRVGVGTITPAERLEVSAGNLRIDSEVGGSASPSTGFLVFNNQFDSSGNTSANKVVFYDDGSSRYGIGVGAGNLDFFSGDNFRFFRDHQDETAPGVAALTIFNTTGNVAIGTTSALTRLDLAGNLRATGKATAVLTGSIDPAASTTVTGVGTLFTTELVVGDRITVTGETRTVTAIASNTSLTVDAAFTDNANDTSPDALYAVGTFRTSAPLTAVAINDLGHVVPGADDTYDLGSNTLRWRDLYLGPATLHIGTSAADEAALTYNTSTNVLGIDSTGTVEVNGGSGSTGCTIDASGNFICSGTVAGGGGAAGAFLNGGNTFAGAATLGTNDDFALNFEINGSTRMMLNTSGNLGIGTSSPSSRLHVNDEALGSGAGAVMLTTGDPITPADLDWSLGGGERAVIMNGGPTGGCCSYPTTILSNSSSSPAAGLYLGGIGWGAKNGGTIDTFTGVKALINATLEGAGGATGGFGAFMTFNTRVNNGALTERMRIANDGNIGIGDTTPTEGRLVVSSVTGTSALIHSSDTTGAVATLGVSSAGSGFGLPVISMFKGGALMGDVIGFDATNFGLVNGINLSSASGKDIGFRINGTTEAARITTTNRFGIGTATPQSKVDIEGGAAIGASYSGTTAAPTNGLIVEGVVGIGTNNPTLLSPVIKLHVAGGDVGLGRTSVDQSSYMRLGHSDDANFFSYLANNATWNGTNWIPVSATGWAGNYSLLRNENGKFDFYTGVQSAGVITPGTPALSITNTGNVGIGTTSPQSRLDVEGGAAIGATYSGTTVAPANGLIVEGSVGIGDSSPAATLTVGSGDLFQVAGASGNVTTSGDLALNGGDLTTTATTFNLVNSTATTVNFAGGATTAINIGPSGATPPANVNIAGGGADTGCTIAGSTGNLTCTGNIVGGTTGTAGYWTRSGVTLTPSTSTDNINTGGNIATGGTGTITSSGLLTASNGLTLSAGALSLSAGAVSLTGTSGSIALTGFGTTSITSTTATGNIFALVNAALTTGTLHSISSTSTVLGSGVLLGINKTGASGSTAFTGAIQTINYGQTFNGGVALNSTGKVFQVARSIFLDNVGQTHTISGAVATFSDTGGEIAGQLDSSADVVQIGQNYLENTGAALNVTTGTVFAGLAMRVNDDGTFTDSSPFAIDNIGRVGIGTAAPGQLLELVGGENSSIDLKTGALTLRSSVNTVAGAQFGTVSSHKLTLFTANTDRLNILADGSISLNGDVTVTGGKSLQLSGGNILVKLGVGSTGLEVTSAVNSTVEHTIFTSQHNTGSASSWSANNFNVTNNQLSAANTVTGVNVQFTQNTAVAGVTEAALRLNLKQNDSSSTDATVAALLDIANNDTATGNQITVTDGIKITGTNITNGLNFSGTFDTNLINSSIFKVLQSGAIVGNTFSNDPSPSTSGHLVIQPSAATSLIIFSSADTTSKVLVQNSIGATVFDVDTANKRIGIGAAATTPTSTLDVTSTEAGTNALTITNTALTTGHGLKINAGNFTDDSGRALYIDTTETAETADILLIETDFSTTNNQVFKIEADGEAFSDIGFTAGAFSTKFYDGSIESTGALAVNTTSNQAVTFGSGLVTTGGGLTVNGALTTAAGQNTNFDSGTLFVDAANNRVGIGTTSTFHPLDIIVPATNDAGVYMAADELTTGWGMYVDSTSDVLTSGTVLYATHDGSYTATTTVSGNVFGANRIVNVNDAGATLTLSGAVASFTDNPSVSAGTLTHTADVVQVNQARSTNTGAALNVTTAGTGLALRVNDDGTFTDSTSFVVDATGNVGIGMTAPSTKLEIQGTSPAVFLNGTTSNMIRWNINGLGAPTYTTRSAGTKLVLFPNIAAGTSDYAIGVESGALWFSTDGDGFNVGHKFYAGTTLNSQMSFDGKFAIRSFAAATATSVCYDTTTLSGLNTLATCSSSIRYKEDIKPLKVELDKVLALQPVDFKWKNRDERSVGFIAEDVEKLIPEVITYNREGQIEGIEYKLLAPYMIEILKQHHSDIAKLPKLDEIGDLKLAGSVRSQASGFAEMMPSKDALEEGEVVVIDAANGGVRRAVGEKGDSLLAGVVSTKAGFTTGKTEAGSFPVALSGRASVRVVGPVEIGDPITLSLAPGVGVKAEEASYIVGTSLQKHEGPGPGIVTIWVRPGWYNGIEVAAANTDASETDVTSPITDIVDFKNQKLIGISSMEGAGALWTIDMEGRIKAKELIVEKVQAKEIAVEQTGETQAAGEGVIPLGSSTVTVDNPMVRYNSRIFVTFYGNTEGGWWISHREDGKFVISLGALASTDLPFEYLIVGVVDNRPPATPPPQVEPPAEEPAPEVQPETPPEEAPEPEISPEPAPEPETSAEGGSVSGGEPEQPTE